MKMPKQRLAELEANPDDRRHGTKTGVNLGCKCRACKRERYRMADEKRERPKPHRPPKRSPKDVCTVNDLYLPMMGRPNVDNVFKRCCWCGAPATNLHHIVKRSAGRLVVGGREVSKPTVRLCGDGNASGCHAKAHAGLLHFRWVEAERVKVSDPRSTVCLGNGHWEGLETEEPVKYQEALANETGWRKLTGTGPWSASESDEKE